MSKENYQRYKEYHRLYRKLHRKLITEKERIHKTKIKEKIAGRKKSNKCEICSRDGKICFDHDHTTGKFRGWICYRCNLTLGLMEDNKELFLKIINYLK